MKKSNWKSQHVGRLKIASFVFALVGIFMLVIVPQEVFFHREFSGLEQAVETNTFKWGIKVFVIVFLIVLVKNQNFIDSLLKKHGWLRIALQLIYISGAIGWVVGLGSLLLP